jgi:integrase
LNARTVRLDSGTTKNGAGRMVVLDGKLLETIKAQWERRKVAEIPGQSPTLLCAHVFHHDGKPIRDFRKSWDKARTETGLSVKMLHDFRRTAVRNMVRAGVHERVAMSVSGHKTRSVFDRYNIVSEDDLKEAAPHVGTCATARANVECCPAKEGERKLVFGHSLGTIQTK